MSIFKSAIVCTLSGALMASQMSLVAAAPLPTNVAVMKSMTADGPIQVYWRGGWGWGLGFGALAGAIIGGAIASNAYGYYGSPYYYGYAYPYYGPPHAAYYGYGTRYGYGATYGYGASYGHGPYAYYGAPHVYGYPYYYRSHRPYWNY